MTSKSVKDLSVDDLREYLAGWQVDAFASEAIMEELVGSLEKIHIILQYLPSDSGRILQIGSSPFFLSSLLHRFGDYRLSLVDFANVPGVDSQEDLEATISDAYDEGEFGLTFRAFDIEETPFPYSDETFEGVILFDVLQRLTRDPVFVLSEIHRMLKPGGWLLFCSPNAAFYGNLVKVWLSQNPFALYSTQAVTDRDNRPFTIPEIGDLFVDINGLTVERLAGRSTGNAHLSDWRLRIARMITQLFKRNDLNEETIFCIARKTGDFLPSRPQWLYKTYAPYYPPFPQPLKRSKLRLPEESPGPRRYSRRICKLCDVPDWNGEDWLNYLDQMGEPFQEGIYHRKAWEWAQGLYALDQLGLLHEDATALGVGTGTEQIVFYLANRIQQVTATDIYGQGSFAGNTAQTGMLVSPEKYAKIPFRRDHLSVTYMDGTDLEYPDAHFDFAFSFSSIEHFGSHRAASQAVREMGRVIKPGGAVIITTEVILNGTRHLEYYRPSELVEVLVNESGLFLLEDIDFSLSDLTLAHPVDFSHPGRNGVKFHVICQLGGVYWTSVCLVLLKPH
jgi:SAM-dependent methyltransferase